MWRSIPRSKQCLVPGHHQNERLGPALVVPHGFAQIHGRVAQKDSGGDDLASTNIALTNGG